MKTAEIFHISEDWHAEFMRTGIVAVVVGIPNKVIVLCFGKGVERVLLPSGKEMRGGAWG